MSKKSGKDVVIIGGGAAGFFAAIACAEEDPETRVRILEKSAKLLSKVRVSGGGRCNVTHACYDPAELVQYYPRGSKELRGPFNRFSPADTQEWFLERGIQLKTESDGRMFPVSDRSESIVNCLLEEADRLNIEVKCQMGVTRIQKNEEGLFELYTPDGAVIFAQQVLVASGGGASLNSFEWLKETGHKIISPVPSLFTFNIPDGELTKLMGVAVESAGVRIKGSPFQSEGPLLITHWGMSGPAILKLSSFAARYLAGTSYHFSILVRWLPGMSEEELKEKIDELRRENGSKKITAHNPFRLPKRLWEYLVVKTIGKTELDWAGLNKDSIRNFVQTLLNDEYKIMGKTTFKEEFVTCGGIALNEIDFKTMQSKLVPGLYFAGEVLDIDAVTGGFNFQAAWTCGYIAGKSMANARSK